MNKNSGHIDEVLLGKFLTGETTSDDNQNIINWLQEAEANQKQLDQLESIWLETGKLIPTPVAVDTKKAWHNVSDKISISEKSTSPKLRSLNQRILTWSYGVAALLAITFGIFKFVIQPQLPIDQIALNTTNKTLSTTLPDGSDIVLNLNTNISYPERFNKNERRVNLDGEAMFEVEHNTKQPFIIKAGNAYIKVLGTSFNVNAFGEKDVEVSVRTGKVQLFSVDTIQGDTTSVFLTAGQKGVLPQGAKAPVKLDEPMQPDELYWMNNTLVFNHTPIYKVIRMLEKYYPVKIEVSNQMALECFYTATFTDADAEDIIIMLAATFNFTVEKEQQHYVLKGNGCLDN